MICVYVRLRLVVWVCCCSAFSVLFCCVVDFRCCLLRVIDECWLRLRELRVFTVMLLVGSLAFLCGLWFLCVCFMLMLLLDFALMMIFMRNNVPRITCACCVITCIADRG